jgi:hypothetical protein
MGCNPTLFNLNPPRPRFFNLVQLRECAAAHLIISCHKWLECFCDWSCLRRATSLSVMRKPRGISRHVVMSEAQPRNRLKRQRSHPVSTPSRLSFHPGAAPPTRQKRFYHPARSRPPQNDARFDRGRSAPARQSAFFSRRRPVPPKTTVVAARATPRQAVKALFSSGAGLRDPKRPSFWPGRTRLSPQMLHLLMVASFPPISSLTANS